MSEAYCNDCGITLSSQTEICPVCTAEKETDTGVEISKNEDYLSAVDNQVPENYPGY